MKNVTRISDERISYIIFVSKSEAKFGRYIYSHRERIKTAWIQMIYHIWEPSTPYEEFYSYSP